MSIMFDSNYPGANDDRHDDTNRRLGSELAALRSEAKALYSAYVAALGRLAPYESTEGMEAQQQWFRAALVRLGALEPGIVVTRP